MADFNTLIALGVDYPQFVSQGNDEQIQHLLREQAKTERTSFLTAALNAEIQGLDGSYTLLVAAEMWCPDCLRNVPAFQALCRLAPNINMRIITRDQATSLFRQQFGVEKVSIPFAAILDSDLNPIGTFIERPQSVLNGDEQTLLAYKQGERLADTVEDIVAVIRQHQQAQ
ncbi:thioredoxin family protein [Erwiniaceae bacterium CAU 1747]